MRLVTAILVVAAWVSDSQCATNDSKIYCQSPYTTIGGRCLFIDTLSRGSWFEMLSYCHRLNGDLLKLDDANVLTDITDYIHYYIGESKNYWIGASDDGHEGVWQWTDGQAMRMGVPLWYHCGGSEQPDGGTSQNCAAMMWGSYYHVHDESCYSSHYVICEDSGVSR